jgi:glycerol uptake facilitator-like aquaporin
MPTLAKRVFSEWLGTAFLLATVIGSGIMAQKLAGGNGAIALLCNTLPTGAILVVLILVFGPLSGAHLNPAAARLPAVVIGCALHPCAGAWRSRGRVGCSSHV